LTATTFTGNGAALTNLNAGNLLTGTLPVARGGTGVTSAQGNGSKVQLASGTTTIDNCLKFDAAGNSVDAGNPCGTITAVNAGAGLTGGSLSGSASLALSNANRTRGIVYLAGCDTCSPLLNSDDQKTIYLNVIGTMTFNSVTCFIDAGSATINIARGGVSPTNIMADLPCSTSLSGASTSTLTIPTLNLNETLDFVMVSTSGTRRATVAIQTTVN